MLIQARRAQARTARSMAEQAASAVASVVIGGVTDRAFNTVMQKLRSGSRPAAAHEKLQRLETLVLKLRCAVEVSEKHAIGSASLLEWRDRLREATMEGGAAVLEFQRRARKEEKSKAAATSAPGKQQPAGGGGGAGAASSALYFTRSALGSMAQRVRDATRRLFSADEDMKKMDSALEKMERLSPDITTFLVALQVEISPELDQPRAKRMRRLPMIAASAIVQLESAADEAREDLEREARMLATVLRRTLRRTEIYYLKKTDDRDMEGLEWLVEWASVLREAVERGNAVLQTLCPDSDVIHKTGGGALEEDSELYSFARAVERLVQDEQCFAILVCLCPRKRNTGPSNPSEYQDHV